MDTLIKIWKYSLGSFSDDKTAPYDNYVATVRTVIFVSYMVTNAFIISGVIKHWDDSGKSGRVVYGTGLENQRGCKSSVGSNPTSSVIISSYLMFL